MKTCWSSSSPCWTWPPSWLLPPPALSLSSLSRALFCGNTSCAQDSFDVDLLTDLLKMTKDPEPLLLDFLAHICKKFSLLGLMQVGEHKGEVMLQLDDNCKVVGPRCFQLMQNMVAEMGSKVLVLKEVHLEHFGGLCRKSSCLSSHSTATESEVGEVSVGFDFQRERGWRGAKICSRSVQRRKSSDESGDR